MMAPAGSACLASRLCPCQVHEQSMTRGVHPWISSAGAYRDLPAHVLTEYGKPLSDPGEAPPNETNASSSSMLLHSAVDGTVSAEEEAAASEAAPTITRSATLAILRRRAVTITWRQA